MDHIITKNVRRPGEPGTIKLQRIYGDDLVCVRYKYDYKKKKRYKTIELLVDEKDWEPCSTDQYCYKRVYIKIGSHEMELQKNIKAAGAIWNAEKKAWKLAVQVVRDMDIEDRIVIDIG
ncbi:hypothetical protein KAR48_10450 [bacterium]|nr:hypothetical protein [bacterium]